MVKNIRISTFHKNVPNVPEDMVKSVGIKASGTE